MQRVQTMVETVSDEKGNRVVKRMKALVIPNRGASVVSAVGEKI